MQSKAVKLQNYFHFVYFLFVSRAVEDLRDIEHLINFDFCKILLRISLRFPFSNPRSHKSMYIFVFQL